LIFIGTLAGQQDPQIQKLIQQLGDEAGWVSASKEFRAIGEPAVKPLLSAIGVDGSIKDTPLTRRALDVLGSMGPTAKAAYSKLYDAAPECEPKIYVHLLHTLGDLVPYSESQGNQGAEQALLQASKGWIRAMDRNKRREWSREYSRFRARLMVDPDAGLGDMLDELKKNRVFRREVAAEVLGRMGAKAEGAIPILASCLRQQRSRDLDDFRSRAAEAMIQIAPNDPRCAVAYSYRLMQAPTETERAEAALRIGAFGKAAKTEVKTLITSAATSYQKSDRVRCESITALGMIGPDAKDAIPELKRLSESKNTAIAVRAKAALKQIEAR
jgi:hypothetical protein